MKKIKRYNMNNLLAGKRAKALAIRACNTVISGSSLFILLVQFGLVENSLRPDEGWVVLLLGLSFFSFTVTRDFINSIGRDKKITSSFEIEMGIIGMGLVFISPSLILSFYFGGVVVLSSIIIFAKILLVKERADPNNEESQLADKAAPQTDELLEHG